MFYIYMISNHNNIIISFTILNLYRIIFSNYVILKKSINDFLNKGVLLMYCSFIHEVMDAYILKVKYNKILSYRNHYFIIVVFSFKSCHMQLLVKIFERDLKEKFI